MYMRGTDILRGVVFGRIDHPDYTIQMAIMRAVEVCSIPGKPESLDSAYLELMECLDVVTREEVFPIIEALETDVLKDYCYSASISYLESKGLEFGEMATEILKDMIFKKLLADESTKKCMYEYAYKKLFFSNCKVSEEEINAKIEKITSGYIGGAKDAYEYVLEAVKEIRSWKEDEDEWSEKDAPNQYYGVSFVLILSIYISWLTIYLLI